MTKQPQLPSDPRFINYTGATFDRLTVLRYAGRNRGASLWICKCKCGKVTKVAGSKLRNKHTRSCGCLGLEIRIASAKTHGLSNTPEHAVWKTMKARCLVKTNKQYPDYGGRGITVCKSWAESFEAFIKDMGRRPNQRMTLERRDNNKGYSPDNCYWSTKTQQGRNKRSNRILELDGKSQCLSAWAEQLGMPDGTLHSRLKKWGDVKLALTRPLRGKAGH